MPDPFFPLSFFINFLLLFVPHESPNLQVMHLSRSLVPYHDNKHTPILLVHNSISQSYILKPTNRNWTTRENLVLKKYNTKILLKTNFTPFSGKIWYPKSYYICQWCNCHYQRIQGVLTSNKRHLRQGRAPKLFLALQRPAISKCMLTKKPRSTISFFNFFFFIGRCVTLELFFFG